MKCRLSGFVRHLSDAVCASAVSTEHVFSLVVHNDGTGSYYVSQRARIPAEFGVKSGVHDAKSQF